MTTCNNNSSTSSTQSESSESSDTRVTYCDGDRANNVWVEGADAEGNGGVCLLDTMTQAQLVYVLQRDPKAREDLRRVTTDATLLELADTVPSLPTAEEGDQVQRQVNNHAASIPFYSVFQGKAPFAR